MQGQTRPPVSLYNTAGRYRKTLDEHQKTIKDPNIILITQEDDPNFVSVKFLDCEHTEVKRLAALQKHNSKCNQCFELDYKSKAKLKNLEVLGASTLIQDNACDYRLCRCLKCNSEFNVILSQIKGKSKVTCDTCFIKEVSEKCKELNFTFISKDSACYCKISCDFCKSVKLAQYSNIRSSRLRCAKCNNSAYNRKSNIYLQRITTKRKVFLKLGHSENIHLRHTNFKIKEEYEIETLFSKAIPTKIEAHNLEKKLAKIFKAYNLSNEEMKLILENGHTECYSENSLGLFLLELENLTKEY